MSERELPIPSETHHGAKPAVAYTPMRDAFAPEERSAKITALTKTTCAHAARGFPQRRCLGLPDLAGALATCGRAFAMRPMCYSTESIARLAPTSAIGSAPFIDLTIMDRKSGNEFTERKMK
jgi:hypothetical protein